MSYISDCEDLIKQMLTVDCKKRYTMEQIINHKWMQQDDDNEFILMIREFNINTVSDPDIENLSETVLDQMENVYGQDRGKIIEVSLVRSKDFFLCI